MTVASSEQDRGTSSVDAPVKDHNLDSYHQMSLSIAEKRLTQAYPLNSLK